ncbi:hypothetical protein [uncultured Microbulbifer sp.]|uniref:hypothetical protein n=1 Tax=uncultured Microbulbifer sp. TaxID=348147 RepID=UPI00261776DA|nr:hypothetical protein [uncultured Microbulbifer sp.]
MILRCLPRTTANSSALTMLVIVEHAPTVASLHTSTGANIHRLPHDGIAHIGGVIDLAASTDLRLFCLDCFLCDSYSGC